MMTLWHKSTESAKGSGLVVGKKGKNVGIMTAYVHRSQDTASRWCYLTELLKLEQENKKSQEKLEIAVKALEFYEKPFACFHHEYNIAQHHKKAAEALEQIKELDK